MKRWRRSRNSIEKFADIHALPLPGRLQTHKDYRIMLLPSDMSKSAVYRFYEKACESEQLSLVSRHERVSWALFFPAVDDSSITRTMSIIVSTKDRRYRCLKRPKNLSGANLVFPTSINEIQQFH